jgi:hypothetical protein
MASGSASYMSSHILAGTWKWMATPLSSTTSRCEKLKAAGATQRKLRRINGLTPMAVVSLAKVLQVHPAIVAGRIRHEEKNYRLLSHFVGSGEVRRQFELDE